jgi:FxsC-like protein
VSGADPAGKRGSYFYLSYAHASPLAGVLQGDPDPWVNRFFHDLTAAVGRLADPASGLTPGFVDQEMPVDADWTAELNRALSTAEVFVPLYSPPYFARSWPGKEWACFRDRLALVGIDDPVQRCAPVLWVPLPYDQSPPGLDQAMALGAAEPAYAENGLRALLRLTPYRASYDHVVGRLARRIVDLAELDTLTPSPAPDLATVPSAFLPGDSRAVFAVAVAAPPAGELATRRDRAGYGVSSTDWRAFPEEQKLSLADYAGLVAEQLDFAVTVADFGQLRSLPTGPGVLLVDPWLAGSQQKLAELRTLTAQLPPWIIPLLVFGSGSGDRAAALADDVRGALGESARRTTETAQRAISGVETLGDFVSLMPVLVAEAERQYLRLGPVRYTRPKSGSRPMLTNGWPMTGSDLPPQSAEETPDA